MKSRNTFVLRVLLTGFVLVFMGIQTDPCFGTIININATQFGFTDGGQNIGDSNPAPGVGQVIYPFHQNGSSRDYTPTSLNSESFGAGTYTITNALAGQTSGFVGNCVNKWEKRYGWGFVITEHLTGKVVYYGTAGDEKSTLVEVALQPAVQNFSATFTLSTATILDFMIQDYILSDNLFGVSLKIEQAPVPLPGAVWLLGSGLVGLLGLKRKFLG